MITAGYNEIKMVGRDQEKTNFITQWGNFNYNLMAFGLINDGATYQRMA